jgi:hypothetical protein
LDIKFSSILGKGTGGRALIGFVNKASRGPAGFGRDPEVRRSGIENHGEGLRGGSDLDGSIILGIEHIGDVFFGEREKVKEIVVHV